MTCFICIIRDLLCLRSLWLVCYLCFICSIYIFCGLFAMPILGLFALFASSVLYGSSTICVLSVLSTSSVFCDLFAICALSTPSASFILYSLFAICALFVLSASSVSCSIYVFFDLFYLFLHYKSQPKAFISSKKLINQALYLLWLYHPLYPLLHYLGHYLS